MAGRAKQGQAGRLVALALLLGAPLAGAQELPSAATTRAAFEAQYPKQGASAAALELERLAARIGVDLAPRLRVLPDIEPNGSDNEDQPEWEPPPTPTPRPPPVDVWKDRPRPTAEAAKRRGEVAADLGAFITREVQATEEPIGVPPVPLVRWMSERNATIESVVSVALREGEIAWETDVTLPWPDAPQPNFMGQIQLQRILIARALLAMRGGDLDGATRALEAAWRLADALSRRPEYISQLISLAAAKQLAGTLRKLEGADPRWIARLRDRRLVAAFLAAFQNDIWALPEVEELTDVKSVVGRVYRQVAEEVGRRESCVRSADEIRVLWERAMRDHLDPGKLEHAVFSEIGMPSFLNGLERLGRYEIDAELTALVLDARAERAASPRKRWPETLQTLGQGVCPSGKWTYLPDGPFATVAFGTPLPPVASGLELPLSFTAGAHATSQAPAKDGARFANLDGLKVRYKLAGPADAPAIVLVHGWAGSMEFWKEQIPALAKAHRVLVLDLPGHGGSDKPKRDYTMDLFAKAISAVLDDAGVEKAFLVGHSMGTPVIRQFLRRSPTRVLGLVAVDGSLRPFSTDPAFKDRFLAPYKTDRWKDAMSAFVDASFPSGKSTTREETKAIMTATPQHVVISAGEGMFDPEIWTDDPIDVPLLLLLAKSPFWSEEYEAYVRKLARDVDWREFDGVGHFLMLQKPEAINAALLDWLSRRERAGG